ncbi:MAG: hypothetical protein JO228_09015 [Xanthobacteraceae bacterium]|nr:hypothetical protein [Xanthobacteraceae bacterium]
MKTATGVCIAFAFIMSAGEAGAHHQGHRGPSITNNMRNPFIYFNTEVTRHYPNEVTFAGRYLGADPDPGIRLNLRIDRPDGK